MAYTDKQFFEKLKPYVLQDMRENKILASLTASQAFIESSKGNSGLTKSCNNLFGIKGKYNGQGELFWTTEYYNGKATRVQAYFRKYPSWQESIADHSSLFNRLARYENLRGCTDYAKACLYVRQDGYATSPTYTQTLLNVIEKYKLYEWDNEVLGKVIIDVPQLGSYQPTLKKGSRGNEVKAWQEFLNANGYWCGNVDGIFGKNTELGVKQWQVAHGLKADGIIGPLTWKSLENKA